MPLAARAFQIAPPTVPVLLILTALLGTSPAQQGTKQGRNKDPIKAVKSAFRKLKKPEEAQDRRAAALDAVKALDSAALAKTLVRAYRNLEAECGPAIEKRHGILLSDRGERLQRLRDEVQPLHDLQQRILEQLMVLKSAETSEALSKMFYQKQLPLRLRTIGARVAARSVRPRAGAKMRNVQTFLFLGAIESLERAGAAFAPIVLDALEHEDEAIRAKALDTLAIIGAPTSIEALIAFLDRDVAHRLKVQAGDTLAKLTGFELGASPTSWKAWLQKEGRAYTSGEKRLGGHVLSKQSKDSGNYYFGIPVDRSSILFLHDNSLSMRAKLAGGKAAGANKTEQTRLQRSLEELEKALDALKATQRFNVVLFANRVWAFEKKQIPATKKNVQRAKDWIRYQKLELGTCIYNALDAAFVLGGRGVRDRYYETEVDSIFLLSDGAPTPFLGRGRGRGAKRSVEKELWIRQAVRRWNPFDRIQIHTILLGGGGPRSNARRFMEQLAEENGGRFVQVGGNARGARRGNGRKRR